MTSLQQRVPTATSSSNSAGNSSNYPSNVGIGSGVGGLLGGQSRFQNKHVTNPTGKNPFVQKDGSKITVNKGNLYVAQLKNKPVAKSAITFSSVPLPTNTPSLLKENKGKDVSVSLVPGGGAVSGASNVWGATASSTSSTTPSSATQSSTTKSSGSGAPVISLSKPAPWAKPVPAPAAPGGSSDSHSGESTAATEGNTPSEVKQQTANWAETVSDEEDNDSEDEGNKKRPRQQYENLDDNAFSYTGSISASEETTLVDHRFSMIAGDDAARTAATTRGPEWTRSSYSYSDGNNRTGRYQYDEGSQSRGNPRAAPIGAFNRGVDQSPQHFSYEEGFLNRGGPRPTAMGAGRGAEPPSQQPQGYEWRRQKPNQFEPGGFNSYAQPPPPPHQHQQPYGRHMYNNNGTGNFFPPHAGGSGFPGFDRPGNNAYSFNVRTNNSNYNSSLEFNSHVAPVSAGAGGYGAAVLKPAPPQPASANEERDPVETEELAQQKAIENARRELELLDLTRQQKLQQQQQQQLQELQQQQQQELQQQQQQHRMEEFSQPPPLLHSDFQSRNFPMNKQVQFHSGFAPPPAASRSGPHPPFKAHAGVGDNYPPKRGGPTSGGYGRVSNGPSDYAAGPQRHFNAVPSKADQEVVWERKKKVEEPKSETTDADTTVSPAGDSASATAPASKPEDASASTSAAPAPSQGQSAGSSLAQQPTQAVRTEPVAAPSKDVKARSYSSLFVQNNDSSSAAAPSGVSEGTAQSQSFQLRPAYPGPTNPSSSQSTFSGMNVEGLAGDAYLEGSQAQGPKKRFLFDPKSNQMVEPTAVVSSDSKSFPAGSNPPTSKAPRQPYVKKGSQESSLPGNGTTPAARSSTQLNRKGAEDSEGKWLRNSLPPVAAVTAAASDARGQSTELSEGSGGQDKADRDAASDDRSNDEESKPQTSRVPSSVLARPQNQFADAAASKRAAFEASVEQANRVNDAKKEARTAERQQRGPRSKGFLFRYNDAGELEQVLSEEELAKLKSDQEEAAAMEELEAEEKEPAAQSSTAASVPPAAERPQHVIAWQTPHSTLQVVGGVDSSKGDKDARKSSTLAPKNSTSGEAPAELAVPALIPPYNSLSGFNVPADSFQPVSFAGLGLPDRPGSSGPSALEGGMTLTGGSPERSRIIGLNSPMPGLWSQNVPALNAPPPTPLQMIQPQQNPNAELDKSLTRSSSASLGHGGYSSLDSLGGLGGILQNSLLDSAETNRWNQDFHNFPSFNSAGFGGKQEDQIQNSFIDNLTDLVVEASFSPFGGLSSPLHSNKASSAMLSADSHNSIRQDRGSDSAEPQAPIGSGGKRLREPRSGGEEASNFVKASLGRGRSANRPRLPHPTADRRARRFPEGDDVRTSTGEGDANDASKDLEGGDRNDEVPGRGPGRSGGRSGRGRGRGRSERSDEDREYRPPREPREFKGGRGRGRGEGHEAKDSSRGAGGREGRHGRGFRRSGPPPSEDNSNDN